MNSAAWNVVHMIAHFVPDAASVTHDEYAARLRVCDGCGNRLWCQCLLSGSELPEAARCRASRCPAAKWR